MKTLVELAEELEIPPTTLRSAAKGGKFTVQKTGRDLFVFEETEEFKSWLANYRTKGKKIGHKPALTK